MLQDRLVCRLHDAQIQFLDDLKLTLTTALDNAIIGEDAVRQSIQICGTVLNSIM